MSHFAELDENNVVVFVTVGRQEDDGAEDALTARVGRAYKQTSYNTRGGIHYQENGKPSRDQSKAFRKNYAGIGFVYDAQRDAFIPPQPHFSWTLDEKTCLWTAPIARPNDGNLHIWNEDLLRWIEV